MVVEMHERAADAQLVQAFDAADSFEVLTAVEGVDDDLANALIKDTKLPKLAHFAISKCSEIKIIHVLVVHHHNNNNNKNIHRTHYPNYEFRMSFMKLFS